MPATPKRKLPTVDGATAKRGVAKKRKQGAAAQRKTAAAAAQNLVALAASRSKPKEGKVTATTTSKGGSKGVEETEQEKAAREGLASPALLTASKGTADDADVYEATGFKITAQEQPFRRRSSRASQPTNRLSYTVSGGPVGKQQMFPSSSLPDYRQKAKKKRDCKKKKKNTIKKDTSESESSSGEEEEEEESGVTTVKRKTVKRATVTTGKRKTVKKQQ